MRTTGRLIILIGLLLVIGLTFYISANGAGLKSIYNAKIIKQASQNCPGQVDEFGNCLVPNYRSAYYRDYYFDNSSYRKGK